eukprot:gene1811-953_t
MSNQTQPKIKPPKYLLCGKLKIEEDVSDEEKSLIPYYGRLTKNKLLYFTNEQDEEPFGEIDLEIKQTRARSNSELEEYKKKRNSQKFFDGIKDRSKSGFGLFKKAVQEKFEAEEKELKTNFEKISINEVIDSAPKKDPLFMKSFKISIYASHSKRNDVDILDKNYTISLDSDEKRSVWENYLSCLLSNKNIKIDSHVYSVMDQFRPFLTIFKHNTHEEILEYFNYVNINKINDEFVLSLVVLFDQLDKDIVKLIKLGIDKEVEANISSETIFRRNSLASKLITVYFKIKGQKYLQLVLGGLVQSMLEEDLKLEIDSTKVKEDESLEENIKGIEKVTRSILNVLTDTVDAFPLELKTILNYAYETSNKKFEGSGETCVGGIFFLRFFNPALISPVDNRIVETAPKPNLLRTNILLTKILQNVANGIKVNENQKEKFMMNVKELIEESIPIAQSFLQNLSSTFWINEDQEMKPIKVNSNLFLRGLQTFQKAFKDIGEIKQMNETAEVVNDSFSSTLMIGTNSIETSIDTAPKLRSIDLTNMPSIEKRNSKERSPTVETPKSWDHLKQLTDEKYENKQKSSDIIIRPIEIECFSIDKITDINCMEFLKKSITNILNYFQQKCDDLKFGESFDSIGDEKENYVFGQYVKYQFLISISFFFNDKIKEDSNYHFWDILSNLKSVEAFIKEINDLGVDLTQNEKISYFLCELICKKRLTEVVKLIFDSELNDFYDEDSIVLDDFNRSTVIKLFTVMDKQPFEFSLVSHKELLQI